MAPGLRSRRSPDALEQPDLDPPGTQGVEQALAEVALQEERQQTPPEVAAGHLALQVGLKGRTENG